MENEGSGEVERLDVGGLGNQLRQRRGNLSMRAAAADAGVSLSTYSRVEAGHHPDLATFARLCTWLGVAPSRFFLPVAERKASRLEEAVWHLQADPALTTEAANRITSVMRDLYEALASKATPTRPLAACHLRAQSVLRPGVPERLGSVLNDIGAELERRVAEGTL